MDAPARSAAGQPSGSDPLAVGGPTALQVPGHRAPVPPAGSRPTRALRWTAVTVAATAVAGALHVAEAATHADHGDVVVSFYGLTAFVQLATAAALFVAWTGHRSGLGTVRRSVTALLLAGAVGTASLLCLYVLVHGTDLFAGVLERSAADAAAAQAHTTGAHAGEAVSAGTPVSAVDALGTTTVVVQLLALTGFLALLDDPLRRRVTDLLLVLGVLGWALWLTGSLG